MTIAGLTIMSYGFIKNQDLITTEFFPVLIQISVLMLFSTITCVIIFFSFRNTASAEIFFFYIFIFTFSIDIFKIVILMIPNAPLPFGYGMITTRIVYFGRLLGTLSLFSSGLFSAGLEYQRMGTVFLVTIILSAALVWLLPVDVSSSVPGNTWEIGKFLEITVALGLFQLIAVLNFIIAGLKNENKEYLFLAAGIFLAAAGRELLYFLPGYITTAAGMVLLISGTILFGLRTHQLYLWE
jgi:hypothetical protein